MSVSSVEDIAAITPATPSENQAGAVVVPLPGAEYLYGAGQAEPARNLRVAQAAGILSISPNTLRSWERRYGFPAPQRTEGGHRVYSLSDIHALKAGLGEGIKISEVIDRIQSPVMGYRLAGALMGYDESAAEAEMSDIVRYKTPEEGIGQTLLSVLGRIYEHYGHESAQWAFAARFGGSWLDRVQQSTPLAHDANKVLIGDATYGEFDPNNLAIKALRIFSARHGVKTTTLPVDALAGLHEAAIALKPDALVVAGNYADNDRVTRWTYSVRRALGSLPAVYFRRPLRDERLAATHSKQLLQASPVEASYQIASDVLQRPIASELRR